MKRIGLLGGMSWESSAEYYRLVNEAVRDRLGGLHSADCLLRSVDFAPIEELQRTGDWDVAGQVLAEEARGLVSAGAELVALSTNTMHKLADHITAAIDVPFVHIADTTAAAVQAAGLHRVGLLATAYTMEQDFYVGRLRDSHDHSPKNRSSKACVVGPGRGGRAHGAPGVVRRPLVVLTTGTRARR